MPAPQTLMQAVFARLGARLGSSLMDVAAHTAVVLQDAPQQVRRELRLFWDEVEQEAQRLEHHGADPAPSGGDGGAGSAGQGATPAATPAVATAVPSTAEVQARIDGLRAQVAGFSRRLDQVS
jgi:hypothetical protein